MITYLGLGSNLGDRLSHLQHALNRINLVVGDVQRVSRVYESQAMYERDQPDFLNAVCQALTRYEPLELIGILKQIERDCGRYARERYGPREVDIDFLVALDSSGSVIELSTDLLTIPHKGVCERRFVLDPLSELIPSLVLCSEKSVEQMLDDPNVSSQKCSVYENGVLSIHSD